MINFRRVIRIGLIGSAALTFFVVLAGLSTVFYLLPQLPETAALKNVKLQTPLRVYSADDQLIAEFGEKRRKPVRLEQVPEDMVKAFLATEDSRFFEHAGVDPVGVARAVVVHLISGEKRQGASTITMQVARNFFLSREKTYTRKLKEILLALKIERELTKQDILELYLNKIFLGQRSYGIASAAEVYYGKQLNELSLAEMAMIAGLPKAPSSKNPIRNPSGALVRRNHVLRRMLSLEQITRSEYDQASAQPVTAKYHSLNIEVEAPHVAEMAREKLVSRYGEAAYTDGFIVKTSIIGTAQQAANQSLRDNLTNYDRRHGWRGAESKITLSEIPDLPVLAKKLRRIGSSADLLPALVLQVAERSAKILLGSQEIVELDWPAMKWAAPYIDDNKVGARPKTASDIIQPGDVVRIRQRKTNTKDPGAAFAEPIWNLAQLPQINGALVSVNPDSGAIEALVGGYDFSRSKFNRVTMANRQPGSSFKPFIYSSALQNGFTLASIINDAPVVLKDAGLEDVWRPRNDSGKFGGPTRLRKALYKSRNLVSIRILRSMGVKNALKHIKKFGFDTQQLPANLSLALGSGSVTPIEMARGYSVFANGGFLVEPWAIQSITDTRGELLFQQQVQFACEDLTCDRLKMPRYQPLFEKPSSNKLKLINEGEQETLLAASRVLDARNAWLMTSVLQDVIRKGTGRRARSLGRQDIGGKTGTTNDFIDAWFSGFNRDRVTIAWTGFDTPRSMGRNEFGSRAALPMWISFMKQALKETPEATLTQPDGIVTLRIDPENGLLAQSGDPKAIFEAFRHENAPEQTTQVEAVSQTEQSNENNGTETGEQQNAEELF
ncbi:penicillin-binding protein 1A [Pelagibaculum spongiae]|uniref:Penicillin-binding protein 1A n=1 Tax=Pelagibaculum spongiae TaxID=2080658 RepID=A0A2V1GSK5_9GAMM|nr:penicillin-binding protein 1A [Pelagibaculum spongiae]PVZ68272.1 peptidase [Pelagibaculum spongiae]